MISQIIADNHMIRCIVPFSYELEKKGTFNQLCQRIKEVKGNEKLALWDEYNIGKKECDLFDSVQKTMQGSSAGCQGIGQAFMMNQNCKQKYLPMLKMLLEEKEIELTIFNMGLNIFISGIGFLWYELKYGTADIDEILVISNALKELSYTFSKISIIETVSQTGIHKINETVSQTSIDKINEPDIQSDISKERADLFLRIEGKNSGYIRKSAIESELAAASDIKFFYKGNELWYKTNKTREFHFADYILQLLEPFTSKKFFSSREKNEDGKIKIIPDKVILFSVIQESGIKGDDMLPYLFWLGKGYVPSYFVPDYFMKSAGSHTFEPFKDSVWYSGLEGCANIVCKSEDKKRETFYETTYLSRLEDYFYIYLLVLYQYYGLLKYDDEISHLPNDLFGYHNHKTRHKLYDYKQRLDFYLMNSVPLGVSHVSHHMEFFEYLRKTYDIDRVTGLMMAKVTAMNDMVERWRERQKNRKYLFFSVVGGIFVFLQTFSNILGIYDSLGISKYIGKMGFSILSILISILIGFVLWLIVRGWKEE